jgi:hypothetical protein
LAPHVAVFIDTPSDDVEAFALAQQIKTTFKAAGFDVFGVNTTVSGEVPGGIVILCKPPADGPLLNALIQLFVELKAQPNIGTAGDQLFQGGGIEIAVGTK